MGHVRAWAKGVLARVTLVIEFCHDCGKTQPVVWHVEDALWARFADGQKPLCPECFDRRAAAEGVLLRWTAAADARSGPAA